MEAGEEEAGPVRTKTEIEKEKRRQLSVARRGVLAENDMSRLLATEGKPLPFDRL